MLKNTRQHLVTCRRPDARSCLENWHHLGSESLLVLVWVIWWPRRIRCVTREAASRTGFNWVVKYIQKSRHKKSPEPFGSGRGLDKKDNSEPETYCCGGRKVKDNCTGDSDCADIFQNDLFNESIVFHVLSPSWSIRYCLRLSRLGRGIRDIMW